MNRTAIILLLFVISCSEPRQVDWDPYHPNIGVTVAEIEDNGWAFSSADDGICVYRKHQGNSMLVFYMDMQEDCKTVNSQELYIDLNSQKGLDFEDDNSEFIISDKLNQEIDSILSSYNSRRITEYNYKGQCSVEFTGENSEKKKIQWNIYSCPEAISLSAYHDLNKNK